MSALRREQPTILHLHLPPPWFAPLLSRSRSEVVILHLHTAPPMARRFLDRAAAGALLRHSDGVVAVSQWIADVWKLAFRQRIPVCDVVFNAVSLPKCTTQRQDAQPRPPVFGVASRLASDKGLETLLEVAAVILRFRPEATFRIAGVGPYEHELRQRAERLGIADVVAFEGFVKDIAGFWRGIDVSIFTATGEPFGLRLLEPIVAGTPVVAIRSGAGSDEVIDRCRGVVAVPAGDVDGAAQIAVALAADTNKRDRMVKEGSADIEQWFTFDRMEAGVRECYAHALGCDVGVARTAA